MANFDDQLIFITGGEILAGGDASNQAFYYEVKTDRWMRAPPMAETRYYHSSCVLGNSLYVYGGYNEDSKLPLERLANLNKGIDGASHCWEVLRIKTQESLRGLMIPLNHSEQILILRNEEDVDDEDEAPIETIKIDPKNSKKEVMKS